MKKSLLFFTFLAVSVSAQTTIYTENFGAGGGTTNPTIGNYQGFQNTNVTYSGTADIRISTPSTGYTGASGEGCVFLGAVTSGDEKMIQVSGINTSEFTNISLSLGHYKGTNASSNELKIEVSSNGTTWTQLNYTRDSGSGTSTWVLITPSGSIPSTENLRIRITNVINSNVGFRIDDIKLIGESNMGTSDVKKSKFDIYPTVISNGILNISSTNDEQKNVSIYDVNARLVLTQKTNKVLNLKDLPKGNYIVKVESEGATETKKIIIK